MDHQYDVVPASESPRRQDIAAQGANPDEKKAEPIIPPVQDRTNQTTMYPEPAHHPSNPYNDGPGSPVSRPDYRFHVYQSKLALIGGSILIVLGFLDILINGLGIRFQTRLQHSLMVRGEKGHDQNNTFFSGYGIFIGCYLIIAGVVTLKASVVKARCPILTSLGMCIALCPLSFIQIGVAASSSATDTSTPFGRFFDRVSYTSEETSYIQASHALSGVMIFLGVLQLISGGFSFGLACHTCPPPVPLVQRLPMSQVVYVDRGGGQSGAVYGPGGAVGGPDGAVYGPGGAVYGPGGAVGGPGGAVYGPGGAVYGPGGAVYGPGGAVYGPGGAVGGPDGVAGGASYGPGGAVGGPGGVAGGASYGPGGACSAPPPVVVASGGGRPTVVMPMTTITTLPPDRSGGPKPVTVSCPGVEPTAPSRDISLDDIPGDTPGDIPGDITGGPSPPPPPSYEAAVRLEGKESHMT